MLNQLLLPASLSGEEVKLVYRQEKLLKHFQQIMLLDEALKPLEKKHGDVWISTRNLYWRNHSKSQCFRIDFETISETTLMKKKQLFTTTRYILFRLRPMNSEQSKSIQDCFVCFSHGSKEILLNFLKTLKAAMDENKWAQKTSAGVVGVARAVQQQNRDLRRTKIITTEASNDLRNLMASAEFVVSTISRYSVELEKPDQNVGNKEETDDFMNLVSDMGLSVNLKKSSSKYHRDLAAEISRLLSIAFEKQKAQMISLPDLYCFVNKTRITDLVAPKDVAAACNFFRKENDPEANGFKVTLKKFPSGALVVLSSKLNDEKILEKIQNLLNEKTFITAETVAEQFATTIGLAEEYLSFAEVEKGMICRDEAVSNTYFYRNRFLIET